MYLTFQSSYHVVPEEAGMMKKPILAIDASPYALRAGVYNEGFLRDCFEDRPHNIHCLRDFVEYYKNTYPGMPIVSSPLDRWPEGLEQLLRESNISVKWLSPGLMRRIHCFVAPWNRKRRLHRAGLLAYLYDEVSDAAMPDVHSLVLSWEAYTARNTIDVVNGEINCQLPLDEY